MKLFNQLANNITFLNWQKLSKCVSALGLSFLLAMPQEVSASSETEITDQIELKVIKSRSYDDCLYFGETVLYAEFSLVTKDYADIVLEGTEDNAIYYQVFSKTVETGNGSTLITFDAGQCLKGVRAVFK